MKMILYQYQLENITSTKQHIKISQMDILVPVA